MLRNSYKQYNKFKMDSTFFHHNAVYTATTKDTINMGIANAIRLTRYRRKNSIHKQNQNVKFALEIIAFE